MNSSHPYHMHSQVCATTITATNPSVCHRYHCHGHCASALAAFAPLLCPPSPPPTPQELMYRGTELLDVLRLMVLLCACQAGLPRRHLDSLRQEVLHSYGHQHLATLNALEKSGGGSEWQAAETGSRNRQRQQAAAGGSRRQQAAAEAAEAGGSRQQRKQRKQ